MSNQAPVKILSLWSLNHDAILSGESVT